MKTDFKGLIYKGQDMSDIFSINSDGVIKSTKRTHPSGQSNKTAVIRYNDKSIRINILDALVENFGYEYYKSAFSKQQREEIMDIVKSLLTQ